MIDLEDRLRTALSDYAATAHPSAPLDEVEAVLERRAVAMPTATTGGGRGRRALLIAAAAAMIVGAVALVQRAPWGSERAAQVGVAVPLDPPGPLYVLPGELDEITVRNGGRWTSDASYGLGASVSLFGRPDGDGFVDLVQVAITARSPVKGERWVAIDGAGDGGTLYVSELPFLQAARRDGERWITVTGGDDTPAVVALLTAVEVGDDGVAGFVDSAQRVVIDRYVRPAGAAYSTYYEASSDGIDYVVETAGGELGGIAHLADRAAAVEVDGTDAWLLTREDPEVSWAGVVWRATPNRIVAVSADADPDTVVSFAERLTPVSEQRWEAALPGFESQPEST